jgi:hypothetical protein
MQLGRSGWRIFVAAVAFVALIPAFNACRRRKTTEVNPIVPSFTINRPRAPLGSAVEITYNWNVEPSAKKLGKDYKALVHFLDSHGVMLFDDDHMPTPPTSAWEPGKSYSYTLTKFIPIYPYVGESEVRMGLYRDRERVALKGEDTGMQEYKVGKIELLPQTENIFLVYKEGWHNPESRTDNPGLEVTWTKKDALVSFKNPKKDVIIYLEADTNSKAFEAPPVLTIAVAGKVGLVVPIENSEVFLKKIRVKAADLGNDEWIDLRLSMNQSFVPKLKGVNATDDRELGLMVYHLYVGEADKLGSVPNIVEAVPVSLPAPSASPAPSKGAARPGASPAAKASPPAKVTPKAKATPKATPKTP